MGRNQIKSARRNILSEKHLLITRKTKSKGVTLLKRAKKDGAMEEKWERNGEGGDREKKKMLLQGLGCAVDVLEVGVCTRDSNGFK